MIAEILAALLAAAAAPGDAVARVDGTSITRADVLERMRVLADRGQATTPSDATGALVDEALLAAEARRLGLDRDASLGETIAAERRKLLASALERDLADKASPTDDLLRGLYHSTGDAVRLLLVKAVSREEATASLERVRGGADLASEAARSPDPELAGRRGDTGLVSRGQLEPALADQAFGAPLKTTFGPVELKLGWAIGQVLERTVADDAGFALRRPALEAFARRQLAAEAVRHLTEQLRSRSGAQVDEAFLRGLGNRIDATPEELDHVVATVNGAPVRYRAIHPAIAGLTGSGGHLAGPGTKISLAQKAVDDRLLEMAAVDRGLASTPAVALVLPGIERYLLANAVAARLAGSPGASTSHPAVRSRVGELRARAKVQVDDARVAAIATAPAAGPHAAH